ncbi:MAG: hypothetical protein WBE37_29940 [Bryobacteraceae bacterium]
MQALCDAGVDFVVIGGLAATLHGGAQVTYDLDICYSRASANLRRLIEALAPFHPRPRAFPLDLPFVWDEATMFATDIGEIDLLAKVTGLGAFDDVMQHSMAVEAFGRPIITLDLPGLIRAKRATGRPRDFAALAELESLLEAGDA